MEVEENGDFDICSFYYKLSPSLERCLESEGLSTNFFFCLDCSLG